MHLCRLLLEFFRGTAPVPDALLHSLEQLPVLVAHHVLGNLRKLLLLLQLVSQLLLALRYDIVIALFFLNCLHFLLQLSQSFQLLFALGNVPLLVVLIDKRRQMGWEGLNRGGCTFPTSYSLTLSSLLKFTES